MSELTATDWATLRSLRDETAALMRRLRQDGRPTDPAQGQALHHLARAAGWLRCVGDAAIQPDVPACPHCTPQEAPV